MSEYVYECSPRSIAVEKMIHGISVDDDGMNEIRYAWEFQRRNTNYREDYNKSLKEVEDFRELGWYSETGPSELDFCRRWRLGVPINPDQSFDELTKIVKLEMEEATIVMSGLEEICGKVDKELFVRLFLYSMLNPWDSVIAPVRGWEPFLFADEQTIIISEDQHFKNYGNSGEVSLTLNFNYSQNSIMKELEIVIKLLKKLYERLQKGQDAIKQQFEEEIQKYAKNSDDAKICEIRKAHLKKLTEMISNQRETEQRIEEKRILHSSRKEFKHYETYLKIWDMRAQYNPPAYKIIGIKVFPDKPKIAADLVRKGFCVAYKLIYRKEYQYQDAKKAREEVVKEHLRITCDKCPQRETCKDLCPAILGYIEQDKVPEGRELLLSQIEYNNEMTDSFEDDLPELLPFDE